MQCLLRVSSDDEIHSAQYGVFWVDNTFKKLLLARQDLVRQNAESHLGFYAIEFTDYSCSYFSEVPIHLTEEQEDNLDEGEVIVFADDIVINEASAVSTNWDKMKFTVDTFYFTSYEDNSEAYIYTEPLGLTHIMYLEAEFVNAEKNGTGVA